MWLLPLAVAAGLFGGLAVAGSWWQGPAPGASDPGAIVGWGLPVARTAAVAAGTLTVGWLITAAFLAPQGRNGVLSRIGRRDVQRAGWAALLWWASATATMLLHHAMMVGLPLREALEPAVLGTYLFAVDTHVAFFVASVAAAIVAAAAPWVSRTGPATVLLAVAAVGIVAPSVTGHSHGLGDHGLAIASGLVHAMAAAAWLGSLVAVAWHILRRDPGQRRLIPRYGRLATISLIALAASGAGAAYARVEQPGDLLGSGYGYLVVLKIALLAGLAYVVAAARRAVADSPSQPVRSLRRWRWLVAEGVLLGAAIGVAVALTRTPNTRIPIPLGSPAEELLGFPFPPPPTVATVLGGWHPDPFWLLVCALLLAGYGWGLVALRRRGVRWPWGRAISWLLGVLVLAWATNGQLAAYSIVSVSLHMLQHMVLAMLVPVLLVLGAPITLALRALRPGRSGDRGPREWLVWGLHSPFSRVITNPYFILALTVLSLYGLYFTGLFPALMSNHLGHVAMQVHFVLSGYLFYWVIIGVDPTAAPTPYWLKMIILLVSLALHGFFGIALMMMADPIAVEWFGSVAPPWLTDAARDTYTAGGIAWALGEIPTLIVMVALSVQWARSDERLARRIDRAADRDGDAELRAYNDRLRRLAVRAERSAPPD
jgi:cytochrome c oxidase assembly factor CtaG